MLQGLTGWHLLIILGVLIVVAVIVAVVVIAVMAIARGARRGQTSDPAARLRTLDTLRQNGQIDEDEYARKRREILGEL